MRSPRSLTILCFSMLFSLSAMAQSESASLSGFVTDPSGAAIVGAQVQTTDVQTGISSEVKTNGAGLYLFASLHPGEYRISVSSAGFKQAIRQGLVLHVQDTISQNFKLEIGPASESVSVVAAQELINTADATVSTVVDRRFVENIPLNGRSFQTLLYLTPGVVATPASFSSEGQFSVNGQRADANYFMVDGVSANIGASPGGGLIQSLGGGLPGFSTVGSTNTLVSVDAMQEFRVQTSTFAPEFGRTPGAQVSIVTRSGTNQLHATLFDYFRNDVLDARDWFVNHNSLPKPKERQNDFGGVLGGPIVKDRTFFFFSYEGLRLQQPSTLTAFVPDASARQVAPAGVQSLLNAYPMPNGAEVGGNIAQFNATFSNPVSLNAFSLRLDHLIRSRFTLFGRYDHAPSNQMTRGTVAPSVQQIAFANTDTLTLGLTGAISPILTNELRTNYSNQRAGTTFSIDNFGGAKPLQPSDIVLPAGITLKNGLFVGVFLTGGLGVIEMGKNFSNEQRQVNVVDNISWAKDNHQVKWGVDYRWLAPLSSPQLYQQLPIFSGLTGASGALAGKAQILETFAFTPTAFLSRNISLYGQDTWRVIPRLTLTYGLRWDINPAIEGKNRQSTPLALQNVDDGAALTTAPYGSSLYPTSFANLAPRVGISYALTQRERRVAVLHGGFGIFYDTGVGSLGQISASVPFTTTKVLTGISYPPTASQVAPLVPSVNPPFQGQVFSADPELKTPRTYQWNVGADQQLGAHQSLSLTYIGAAGRDLLRQDSLSAPNSMFTSVVSITRNNATSDYDGLEVKFQRQMSQGLQALASYTWSHSIDIASNDSSTTNTPPSLGVPLDRGNSDFDIRHSITGALSYDLPGLHVGSVLRSLLGNWSIDDLVTARSALPVTVLGSQSVSASGVRFAARPNTVPGVPLYLYGSQFPGNKAFNPAAFKNTVGAVQGDLPRNFLRGFAAWQDDFTLRRQFHFADTAVLQFRAEIFNVFNHPEFGSPVALTTSPNFGLSAQTLAQNLSPGGAGGGFGTLYQSGGPRSIQLALKLIF